MVAATVPSLQDWHDCLGHPQRQTVTNIIKDFNLPCSSNSFSPYSCYYLGKLSKLIFASAIHTSTSPFEIMHLDVWGLTSIHSSQGYRYIVLFINDYTRFTWMYFLKNISDIFSSFLYFQALVNRQYNKQIKAFHFD